MQVTLGGDRLGSGNKQKISLHNYERSTHDLSNVIRTTMSSGTLVPFMVHVGLPGDTWDINLNVDCLTHPTIGPLFGTYKIQLDVFQAPIRLYQAALHMNMLGIGMRMGTIYLPQVTIYGRTPVPYLPIDNQQIHSSCIFKYLGISGIGYPQDSIPDGYTMSDFNSVAWLMYWDTYKNYYANKQEEIGAVIHQPAQPIDAAIEDAITNNTTPDTVNIPVIDTPTFETIEFRESSAITFTILGAEEQMPLEKLFAEIELNLPGNPVNQLPITEIFETIEIDATAGTIIASDPKLWNKSIFTFLNELSISWVYYVNDPDIYDVVPNVVTFPLANIDNMRLKILQADIASPFKIAQGVNDEAPYGLVLDGFADERLHYSCMYSQEGLALKTYNSDLFNNWISTEWIDGPDGISELTKVSTAGQSFTIDELNLQQKIYYMLNRIALSGGSYDDWLDATYTHDRRKSVENPMYIGGLITNLVFQEVVSNAASADQPLGTLAGRGKIGNLRRGGRITAKIDEPSYIMGIVSITPNIDYSQGNTWDTRLKTMNDFHKPALDQIGFQDLITEQMAWWDTINLSEETRTTKSAGKQPAWTNYMTNVNKVYGNFADQNQQMFMVLNRRYRTKWVDGKPTIGDLTTYIDPSKFNHIFADTRRDAQNFWMQIGMGITVRRKMSAKVMPNL